MTRPPSKQLDFNDPARCLASQVRRLNRLLTNAFEREMAETGVTPSQFFILTAIGRMNGTATAAAPSVFALYGGCSGAYPIC